MAVESLELHYHLRDNAHEMDALVRNKCEAEALAAFLQIAADLGISVQIESSAYAEGGLREAWRFIGKNSAQLSLVLSVIVLIFSRIPASDPEIDALNKEAAKLTIEEKKLIIQKLKRELSEESPKVETIGAAAQVLEGNLKTITRRSNFYRNLLGYDRVTDVGFTPLIPESNANVREETIARADFSKFVLKTDKLPLDVIEGARIEIVAPVLREGNYQWKGVFDDEPISFAMIDQEFKTSVLRKEVSFQNGSSIECVLNVHRKFDEVGDIHVTGYSVAKVISLSDGTQAIDTPQGKRFRFSKKQERNQTDLFGSKT